MVGKDKFLILCIAAVVLFIHQIEEGSYWDKIPNSVNKKRLLFCSPYVSAHFKTNLLHPSRSDEENGPSRVVLCFHYVVYAN